MKIAVTSTGKDLSSDLDPRFGRTSHFLIVDAETLEFEAVENRQNMELPQGAGIQASKTVVDRGVKAVITGNCGPKAFKVLQQAGIQVLTGERGTVQEMIEKYKAGALKALASANVDRHWV